MTNVEWLHVDAPTCERVQRCDATPTPFIGRSGVFTHPGVRVLTRPTRRITGLGCGQGAPETKRSPRGLRAEDHCKARQTSRCSPCERLRNRGCQINLNSIRVPNGSRSTLRARSASLQFSISHGMVMRMWLMGCCANALRMNVSMSGLAQPTSSGCHGRESHHTAGNAGINGKPAQ
jgi:hypothetical protein